MVGKMKKISFLFVFLYFITLLFVVACSETGELPVAPVPEIPSITIPSPAVARSGICRQYAGTHRQRPQTVQRLLLHLPEAGCERHLRLPV